MIIAAEILQWRRGTLEIYDNALLVVATIAGAVALWIILWRLQ